MNRRPEGTLDLIGHNWNTYQHANWLTMSLDVPTKQRQKSRRLSVGHNLITIPQELNADQIAEIQLCFDALDFNKDGRISKSEIVKAAHMLGMNPTPTEANAMLVVADLNEDGFISFEEFMDIMKDKYVTIDLERERLKAAFGVLDRNKDGFISKGELLYALSFNDHMTTEEVSEVMKAFDEWDLDRDGKLNYTEFIESTLCTKIFNT